MEVAQVSRTCCPRTSRAPGTVWPDLRALTIRARSIDLPSFSESRSFECSGPTGTTDNNCCQSDHGNTSVMLWKAPQIVMASSSTSESTLLLAIVNVFTRPLKCLREQHVINQLRKPLQVFTRLSADLQRASSRDASFFAASANLLEP
jgi:hypothetical protein